MPLTVEDGTAWRRRPAGSTALALRPRAGIQSTKDPVVFSMIVFCDIDNNQLEVIAVDV